MNIDEFYDSDPRRRASEEVTFGLNWASPVDSEHLWDLFWVQDTGELYLMSKPMPPKWLPLFSGFLHPRHHRIKTGDEPPAPGTEGAHGGEWDEDDDLGVEIIARVATEDEVRQLLDGWEQAVVSDDGLTWLRQRVASRS